MAKRVVCLMVVAVSACDVGEPGSHGPSERTNVAKAAITIAGNGVSCSSPAPQAFAAGLCVCENVHLVGDGLSVVCNEHAPVDVGVNGSSHVVGDWTISGTLVSWGGVDDVGDLNVSNDLMTPQNVSGVGSLEVGHDLIVGGNVSTVGDLKVGGLARVAGAMRTVGDSSGIAKGDYVPRDAPPCACDAARLIDVKGEVEKARASNDNASIGLQSVRSVGELNLELGGGRYFLDGASSVGALKLHVTKPSALYIAGDLKTVGTDAIAVDENAALDLYVAGDIENVGDWNVGQGTLAGTVRLFIGGGDASLSSVGDADIVGSIYAPQADVKLVGDTYVRGALFAKSLSGTGQLLVDYAKPPSADGCPK